MLFLCRFYDILIQLLKHFLWQNEGNPPARDSIIATLQLLIQSGQRCRILRSTGSLIQAPVMWPLSAASVQTTRLKNENLKMLMLWNSWRYVWEIFFQNQLTCRASPMSSKNFWNVLAWTSIFFTFLSMQNMFFPLLHPSRTCMHLSDPSHKNCTRHALHTFFSCTRLTEVFHPIYLYKIIHTHAYLTCTQHPMDFIRREAWRQLQRGRRLREDLACPGPAPPPRPRGQQQRWRWFAVLRLRVPLPGYKHQNLARVPERWMGPEGGCTGVFIWD